MVGNSKALSHEINRMHSKCISFYISHWYLLFRISHSVSLIRLFEDLLQMQWRSRGRRLPRCNKTPKNYGKMIWDQFLISNQPKYKWDRRSKRRKTNRLELGNRCWMYRSLSICKWISDCFTVKTEKAISIGRSGSISANLWFENTRC